MDFIDGGVYVTVKFKFIAQKARTLLAQCREVPEFTNDPEPFWWTGKTKFVRVSTSARFGNCRSKMTTACMHGA